MNNKPKKPELYFSIDIEADGPIPGQNSMLSLGCAAVNRNGEILDVFEANLRPLPNSIQDSKTMEFWAKNKKAYEATKINQLDPINCIFKFNNWVNSFTNFYTPVAVGYPIAYDFMWVYWYLMKFNGSSPFSHSGIDIKTLAMCKLNLPYRQSTKRNMPKHWFPNFSHTHMAGDDAVEQGLLFIKILNEHNHI